MKKRTNNNDKWKLPSPEDTQTQVKYSFSFNPDVQPIRQHDGKFKHNHLQEWSNDQSRIFRTCKHAMIKVNLEISRQGRFHYHGTIELKDIIRFYVFDLQKLKFHGALEIDFIKDPEVWSKYCDKLRYLMSVFANTYNMHYTIDTSEEEREVHPKKTLLDS